MKYTPLPAAGGALPASLASRRAILGALAASPMVAAATPALAEGDDSELLTLEAEIRRLNDVALDIKARLLDPSEEEYDLVFAVSRRAAAAFSESTGREAASREHRSL